MKLSKSKIITFLSCPMLFRTEYILGQYHTQNFWEYNGKLIHSLIEHYWKNAKIVDGNLVYDKDSFVPEVSEQGYNIHEKFNKARKNFISFQLNRFNELKLKNK